MVVRQKQKKNIQEDLFQIKLSHVEEIIEILAFLDGKGRTRLDSKTGPTTYQSIGDFIRKGHHKQVKDLSRRIKTAIQFIKNFDKDIKIRSSRMGLSLEPQVYNWNKKKSYQTLCLLYLSILSYRDEVDLDVFDQLSSFNSPLLNIVLWRRAIQNNIPLNITYFSDRRRTEEQYDFFLPRKIYLRDGHWRVIGYDGKNFRSIPIHSIQKIKLSNIETLPPIPDLEMDKFKEGLFGAGYKPQEEPIIVKLRVPASYKTAVQKRKPMGKWEFHKDYYTWTVKTYYPEEIYDYVFRWNGILQILEPEELVIGFREKCKSFLEPWK